MKAVHEGVHRWSSFAQVGCSCCRPKKVFWVCVAKSHHEGDGKDSSSRDNHRKARTSGQDHYALLGISWDASPHDIKLAFRQLARKYHPDVNNDSGAADTFKTIRNAYEILSDKTSKDAYDYSLRAQAHAARRRAHTSHEKRSMYGRRAGASYWSAMDDEDMFDWDSLGNNRRERFTDYVHGGEEVTCDEVSEAWDRQRGPSLREGWADSIVDVFMVFCLVGFIWHTLGAQLALTYFVFFIPHNTEHTPWYRFASLVAWLIGGTKGLALHYGLVTTGWLYGKSHDMNLALALLVFWIESHFPQAFVVPRGAILLMAHICLGGLRPF